MSKSSIWPIDRTLSDATTPGQSEPESDDSKGVLRIPKNSSITEAAPSYCLVSYHTSFVEEVLPLCRVTVDAFKGVPLPSPELQNWSLTAECRLVLYKGHAFIFPNNNNNNNNNNNDDNNKKKENL